MRPQPVFVGRGRTWTEQQLAVGQEVAGGVEPA